MFLGCHRCRDNQGRKAEHQNTKFGRGRSSHRQTAAWQAYMALYSLRE
jgi:hypothetical protein